jgi:restriction endonuclease Mrr
MRRRRRRGNPAGGALILAGIFGYAYLRSLGWWLLPLGIAAAALLVTLGLYFARRRRIRVQTLDQMLALTPAAFERAVGTLLRDIGYTEVKNIGRSGDQGIDLLCRDRNGRQCGVQCKRYALGRHIGSPELRRFLGSLVYRKLERGIYVTTSSFSKAAAEVARQSNIELVDGERLTSLLLEQQKVLGKAAPVTAPTR